jgi:hypothetical protein
MLYDNIYTKRLFIDKDLPDDILVRIMKPFLYYYYTYKYGVVGTEKFYLFKNILYFKLKVFYNYNPNFGRKYYTLINNKKILQFNTKHLSFDQIQTNNNYLYNINTEIDNENININNNDDSDIVSSSSNTSYSGSSSSQSEAVEIFAEQNDAEANENENENELEWEQLNNLLNSANLNNISESESESD